MYADAYLPIDSAQKVGSMVVVNKYRTGSGSDRMLALELKKHFKKTKKLNGASGRYAPGSVFVVDWALTYCSARGARR